MDYFVRDLEHGDGAVVDGVMPVDAAQKFIDIVRRNDPSRYISPTDLDIYPLQQRNRLIAPVDPLNGDRQHE